MSQQGVCTDHDWQTVSNEGGRQVQACTKCPVRRTWRLTVGIAAKASVASKASIAPKAMKGPPEDKAMRAPAEDK